VVLVLLLQPAATRPTVTAASETRHMVEREVRISNVLP
jgi:hypothetical protein